MALTDATRAAGITILPVVGMGEIHPGCDLAELLATSIAVGGAADLRDNDVLVVTQKIVSKAEARFVELGSVAPGEEAMRLAREVGKDARLVELVLRESQEIVRAAPNVLITRHRLGLVMANAGIDQSNIGPGAPERVLLLPEDPDASAEAIRDAIADRIGCDIGVVISDSFGRPWRQGVTNIAIGVAGLAALVDERGKRDRNGRELNVTQIALADAIAGAAGLAMGEAAEGIPAAIIRGVDLHREQAAPGTALVRPLAQDLFR